MVGVPVAVVDVLGCEDVATLVSEVHDAFTARGAFGGLAPCQTLGFREIQVWIFGSREVKEGGGEMKDEEEGREVVWWWC